MDCPQNYHLYLFPVLTTPTAHCRRSLRAVAAMLQLRDQRGDGGDCGHVRQPRGPGRAALRPADSAGYEKKITPPDDVVSEPVFVFVFHLCTRAALLSRARVSRC